MNATENDRKAMTKKMRRGAFDWPTVTRDGYVWVDRLIDIGEEICVWSKGEWVKVKAGSAHDWWGYIDDNLHLGGVSFIDPVTGKVSYYTALRVKEKWVEDGTPPHGGRHEVIGLHDPNPYVCIKDTGDKPIELDSKGLPYYPITQSELEEHNQ